MCLSLTAVAWQSEPPRHQPPAADGRFVSYRADPRRLALYWHDEHGQPLRSLGRLRGWLAGQQKTLVFATNGGMYRAGNAPVGLFIQAGKVVTPLDTAAGTGNFYLRPNGVFYLTADGRAAVCRTQDFRPSGRIRYATQSGPMLVIDGRIHPAFQPGSKNLNVRNGVGLLPDGRVLLAMSKQPVSFYEFARYFQQQGCRQALYLDGFVSRTYLPAAGWRQTDGDFGVIIGVTAAGR
ncbi:phosphodiester glycosidase family protein [Hymenobacter gummosus]|uniref:phosphodiester glycosidase family protein n=1 Tax=Hymenobacter gummosus TaxID=1776032 RepID=UPI001FB3A0CA|nr:phosphodiester glycosidase family protein [Hymenobacter gummosus]